MCDRIRLAWCVGVLAALLASCEKKPAQPQGGGPPSASNPSGAAHSPSSTPAGKGAGASPAPANSGAGAPSGSSLPPGHPPVQTPAPGGNAQPPAPPPGASAPGTTPAPAAIVDGVLQLEGLTLRPPADWVSQPLSSNPMGPVAIFLVPAAEGDKDKTEVRITYFPSMHNMPPEPNIDRWLQQVKLPDGTTPKRDQAQITSVESGGAKITIVDVSGALAGGGPLMGGSNIADGRMIAAIIDHPKGPHFSKLTGPKATVDKQAEAAMAFIKSAQAR